MSARAGGAIYVERLIHARIEDVRTHTQAVPAHIMPKRQEPRK